MSGLLGDTLLYTVLPQEEITSMAGLTPGMVGFVLGLNRLVRLAFNHPVGDLYCRLPRRKIMIPAAFLGIIASVCYALSSGPWLIIAGRIIWGLAWSGLWIGAMTMTLDISSDENRGKMSGILALTTTIGTAVCSLSAGVLCDWLGYRNALWVSAFACILNTILWLLFLPETLNFVNEKNQNLRIRVSPKTADGKSLFWKSGFIGMSLFAMQFVYYGVVYSTAILWLEHFFGKGSTIFGSFIPIATLTGFYSAFRIILGAVGGPLSGFLTDRNGKRKKMLIYAMFLGAMGTFLLGSPDFWVSFSGAILGSLAVGAIPTLIYAWVGDEFEPGSTSKSIGIINSFGDFGSALGPVIALNLIPICGLMEIYSLLGFVFVGAIMLLWKL